MVLSRFPGVPASLEPDCWRLVYKHHHTAFVALAKGKRTGAAEVRGGLGTCRPS